MTWQQSWDRLQDLLIEIRPGQSVTVDALVRETGLSHQVIETVLESLTKSELFERVDRGVFVRRSRLRLLVRSADRRFNREAPLSIRQAIQPR